MKRMSLLLAGTAIPLAMMLAPSTAAARDASSPVAQTRDVAQDVAREVIILAQRDNAQRENRGRGQGGERRQRGQDLEEEAEAAAEEAEALARDAEEAQERADEAAAEAREAEAAIADAENEAEAEAEAQARAAEAAALAAEAAAARERAEAAERAAAEAEAAAEAQAESEARAAEEAEAAARAAEEAAAAAEAEAREREEAEAAARAEAEARAAEETEAAARAAEEAAAEAEAEAEEARAAEEADAAARTAEEAAAAEAPAPEAPAAAEAPAQAEPTAEPRATDEERRERRERRRDEAPATTTDTAPAATAPAPTTAEPVPAPTAPAPTAADPAPAAPTAAQEPTPLQAQEPTRFQDVREQRRERVEDGVRIIQEPGARIIIQQGDQLIIRQDAEERTRRTFRDVRRERRGDQEVLIAPREGGVEIVTILDTEGNLLRRIRREPDGTEYVLIDNMPETREVGGREWRDGRTDRRDRRAGRPDPRPGDRLVGRESDVFELRVDLPPPVIRIPRERYIVDYGTTFQEEALEEIFLLPPVAEVRERYTLDQILYSPNLRDYMPRVDLDTVTFDTGSWQLSRAQIATLEGVADAMNAVIDANPNEIFLVEGHTDAVGRAIDNLSLSDRRAESVAFILSEYFDVPPENMVTQGYGEEFLKIDTQEAERRNRRVTIRRITPLMAQAPRG